MMTFPSAFPRHSLYRRAFESSFYAIERFAAISRCERIDDIGQRYFNAEKIALSHIAA
jgi:hypothetical protein